MLKKAAGRTMAVGRFASAVFGLALVLALVLGAGTAALAAVPGDPFKLGRTNTIDSMSTLIGSASGTLLRINNNGGGPALDLRVEEGRAPMNVNSDARVNGLNADQLDGKGAPDFLQESTDRDDFLPNRTYNKDGQDAEGQSGQFTSAVATCDAGDKALTGGYNFHSSNFKVNQQRVVGDEYIMQWLSTDEDVATDVTPNVTCADFPPLR